VCRFGCAQHVGAEESYEPQNVKHYRGRGQEPEHQDVEFFALSLDLTRLFRDGLWSSASQFAVITFEEPVPHSIASCAKMGASCTPETDVRAEGKGRHSYAKVKMMGKGRGEAQGDRISAR